MVSMTVRGLYLLRNKFSCRDNVCFSKRISQTGRAFSDFLLLLEPHSWIKECVVLAWVLTICTAREAILLFFIYCIGET